MGTGSTLLSKLSFQLSVQIYSLLAQAEVERTALFGRVQEGGPHCKIITWSMQDMKKSPLLRNLK